MFEAYLFQSSLTIDVIRCSLGEKAESKLQPNFSHRCRQNVPSSQGSTTSLPKSQGPFFQRNPDFRCPHLSKWITRTALALNSAAEALHRPQQRTPTGESVCENSPSKLSTSIKTPTSSRTTSDLSNAGYV